MKIGLTNLKNRFQQLSIRNSQFNNGGKTDLYKITSVFFFALFLFNLINQIIESKPILERAHYTLPFLILAVLFHTKIKDKLDFIIDMSIGSIMTIQAGIGDFSGVSFLFLLLFRVKNLLLFYILSGIYAFSLLGSSIIHDRTLPENFIIIVLYLFMGAKYYYNIHLPVKSLEIENKDLKNKLSLFGNPEYLKDDQIIHKYPFMKHSGDDPYRKIRDLRLLANDKIYKEIAAINGITEQNQSREFNNMKKNFSSELNRPVETQISLIKAGIELGIIKIDYRHQ